MSTAKNMGSPVWRTSSSSKLVPVAPESNGSNAANKRKRLAKAFPRPLDKQLKEIAQVRVKISLSEDANAQLLALQQRLAGQGIVVKKGELLRAGMWLLATLDDAGLAGALAKVPAIG